MGVFRPRPQLRPRRRYAAGVAAAPAAAAALPARRHAPIANFAPHPASSRRRVLAPGFASSLALQIVAERQHAPQIVQDRSAIRHQRRFFPKFAGALVAIRAARRHRPPSEVSWQPLLRRGWLFTVTPPVPDVSFAVSNRRAPRRTDEAVRRQRHSRLPAVMAAAVKINVAGRRHRPASVETARIPARRFGFFGITPPPADVGLVLARRRHAPVAVAYRFLPLMRRVFFGVTAPVPDVGPVTARRARPRVAEQERPSVRRVWPFGVTPAVPVDSPVVARRRPAPTHREVWQRLKRRITLLFPTASPPVIPLDRLKRVAAEIRSLSIAAESRSLKAPAEIRSQSIAAEDRSLTVIDDNPEC